MPQSWTLRPMGTLGAYEYRSSRSRMGTRIKYRARGSDQIMGARSMIAPTKTASRVSSPPAGDSKRRGFCQPLLAMS